LRIDGGDARIALQHVGPFGGVGVPMQLAERARFERHINAGKFVGDGEAFDVCFFRGAAVERLGGHLAKRIAERWKVLAGQRRGRRTELRF